MKIPKHQEKAIDDSGVGYILTEYFYIEVYEEDSIELLFVPEVWVWEFKLGRN